MCVNLYVYIKSQNYIYLYIYTLTEIFGNTIKNYLNLST